MSLSLHGQDCTSLDLRHPLQPSTVGQGPSGLVYRSGLETSSISEFSTSRSLIDFLCSSLMETPNGEANYYIPVDSLYEALTPEAIRNELRKIYTEKEEQLVLRYERAVSNTAKRLFALLIFEDKLKFIGEFLEEGVGDKDLPFGRAPSNWQDNSNSIYASSSSHKDYLADAHDYCGIKTFQSWDRGSIRHLCQSQWIFQAPIFDASNFEIPHLELVDTTVLPFTSENFNGARGGFGEVWPVQIHPAHQNLHSQLPKTVLAVKRPFSRSTSDFKKEVNMLKDLAARRHPHLIQLLATYRYRRNYHLVFPLMDADLRGYWKFTGKPYWNRETYSWFFRQIRGLASALNAIHNFGADADGPDLGSRDLHSKQPQSAVERKAKYGRHGDIKPENILWSDVSGQGYEGGILQIADLGLGKFHNSPDYEEDSTNIYRSPTYAPPEVDLEKLVSPSYDIWSLGCVFLEFITWLLEGSTQQVAFASARAQTGVDGMNDDIFYAIINNEDDTKSAVVREGVLQWIERLHKHPQCSQMIRDLLRLVKVDMLETDSHKRIKVKDLERELRSIGEDAEKSTEYLLGRNVPVSDTGVGMKLPRASMRDRYSFESF